ncbi:MAG: RdgB/HAM1 family non-canonical purine NTP pyrophosphatase [Planctomycetes bacterium]|nr:RdgB/HAM1 family non-canonical purine NTP pyrophosphatase [Planctomycetota bacterium]
MKLLVASSNAKKLRELTAQLLHVDVTLVTPSDVGGLPEVVEDQSTFRGNAAKKAVSAARASGLWSLADDSGLEVEALNGAPGVLSARFGGAHGDDTANNALLLEKLRGLPFSQRNARFVCALALARPDGSLALEIEGTAHGRILDAPRGTHDFGYDPLFLFIEKGYAETDRVFAEMEPHEKARVSHRGRALREFAERLPGVLARSSAG